MSQEGEQKDGDGKCGCCLLLKLNVREVFYLILFICYFYQNVSEN